ncbi:MAG: response regulator transcription factor [Aquabacterium sp.]|jgi:two-component system response regulator AlgR|uniref:LytR/AlgR family response regulator transcription factor n=1 Tax=Aquabacterium sp. TaxID=1872578 RepID=UPI001B495556|nr:LytTR family DNA-binding domain-containing protein [Aquabacterium sp.]MBP7133116.1 response regulator transcription factor [Aquabacterium sp.]MBP9062736.1 response regulator transcription factor [Aquabacterium sp.]
MTVLTVALIDDEPLARLRLRTLLAQATPACHVMAEFGESVSALLWLREQDAVGQGPDMILLDIQMPGLDGMVLAARLRELRDPPAIVFVTAHAEHAVRAFDVAAQDYLTKPVRLERLQACIDRVQRWRQAQPRLQALDADVIVVHDRGRILRVPVADVLYFKAEQKAVTLHTTSEVHPVSESLTEIEARVGDRFIRVHRNALVARRAMKALARRPDEEDEGETWAVQIMPTQVWLAVSRRQVTAVREAMGECH